MGGPVQTASDVYSFGVLMYEVGGSAALGSSIKCMRWQWRACARAATGDACACRCLPCLAGCRAGHRQPRPSCRGCRRGERAGGAGMLPAEALPASP